MSLERWLDGLSTYAAIPYRPLVVHAELSTAMGDACAAFLEGHSGQPVHRVEVENVGPGSSTALTRRDFLRFLVMAKKDRLVLDWSVRDYLRDQPREELSILELVNDEGELALSQALRAIVSSKADDDMIPVSTFSESGLKGVFGYVSLSQILATCAGHWQGTCDEICSIGIAREVYLCSAETTLAEAIETLLENNLEICQISDSVLTVDSVLAGITRVLHEPEIPKERESHMDRALGCPAIKFAEKSTRLPDHEGDELPLVSFVEEGQFPILVRDLVAKALLCQSEILVVRLKDGLMKSVGLRQVLSVLQGLGDHVFEL